MPEEQEYEPPSLPRQGGKGLGSNLTGATQGGVTVNTNRAVKFAEQLECENNPVQQP